MTPRTLSCLAVLFLGAMQCRSAFGDGQASVYLGRSELNLLPVTTFTTYGGSIGVFAGPVGAELALEHSPVAGIDLWIANAGTSLTNVMGNFVVQIPIGERIQPYATVGYGAIIGSAGLDPFFVTRETAPALNFGGGVKFFFSDAIGVRADYRRFSVQGNLIPDVEIPFLGVPLSLEPNLDRFTVGVAFRF